jgi:hypothetical protein
MASFALAVPLSFALAVALSLALAFRLSLAGRTLWRVRISLRTITAAVATTPATTTTIAPAPGPVRIPRLITGAVLASVLRRRRIAGRTGFGRGPIHRPPVLAVSLRSASLPVALGRARTTRAFRTSTLLLTLALRLSLRRAHARLGGCRPALGLAPLLPVVRPAAAAAVVAEPALALAARTVRMEFLLGTPGHFAAAGVVLRHKGSG